MDAYKVTPLMIKKHLSGVVTQASEYIYRQIIEGGLAEEMFEDVPIDDEERVQDHIHDIIIEEMHKIVQEKKKEEQED